MTSALPLPHPPIETEAALAVRWATAAFGPLRLNDGRTLRVIFPGIPAGGAGPDFRDAMLDADGDILRGDVELHLRTSGWHAHGHLSDPAYASVVLHVVASDDVGAALTPPASGRGFPVLVLPAESGALPAGFTPPCVLAVGRGLDPAAALTRLSLRRLRIKAARAGVIAAQHGLAHALYTLLMEQLGGSANRAAFASIARWLPLALLLERAAAPPAGVSHVRAIAAELHHAGAGLVLRRAGARPMASPVRRLDQASACIAAWFPPGANGSGWPDALHDPGQPPHRVPGVSRAVSIEIAVNAVLPVALAASAWPVAAVEQAWLALPSPGTYGRLRPLERWLGGDRRPFSTAAGLQGGLLLHTDYCSRGMCGRCPMS